VKITTTLLTACTCLLMAQPGFADKPDTRRQWTTVVNNNDPIPGATGGRTFNSYNQPSVNRDALVVFRARSRGGQGQGQGQRARGIYQRDMSGRANPILRVLDQTTAVPQPNNLGTTFTETPAFPRIGIDSGTIATRGNHQPAWRYVPEGETESTRAGTTGIYSNPFGDLITAASKLGGVSEFSFFGVPEFPGTPFEVFPGAPAVAGPATIAFKGNYTTPAGAARTGVYYRTLQQQPIGDGELAPAGGDSPVVLVANSDSTLIPGTSTVFGSTSPPSAGAGSMVFAGFDNEENPTLGGLYRAPLQPMPELTTLVSIGDPVPDGTPSETFNHLGEGTAFDGRFVGFWGAWGEAARTVRLYCPTEGNRDRIAYCNQALECADSGEIIGDPGSICDDTSDPFYGERCYQERSVPSNQGIFIHDTRTGKNFRVADTGGDLDDFLFWNYSGKTPCVGGGDHGEEGGEDDGEPARWRSSAFVAVSGRGAAVWSAFKARTGELSPDNAWIDPVDGLYLSRHPGAANRETLLDTTMAGTVLDPQSAEGAAISELGIERDGFRGPWLVINAAMAGADGEEDEGMAGIYITRVP
jgi:hypothetical protein